MVENAAAGQSRFSRTACQIFEIAVFILAMKGFAF
jgi:hypothetical protein